MAHVILSGLFVAFNSLKVLLPLPLKQYWGTDGILDQHNSMLSTQVGVRVL